MCDGWTDICGIVLYPGTKSCFLALSVRITHKSPGRSRDPSINPGPEWYPYFLFLVILTRPVSTNRLKSEAPFECGRVRKKHMLKQKTLTDTSQLILQLKIVACSVLSLVLMQTVWEKLMIYLLEVRKFTVTVIFQYVARASNEVRGAPCWWLQTAVGSRWQLVSLTLLQIMYSVCLRE